MSVGEPQEIAPGVVCVPGRVANVYLISAVAGEWVLVDAGRPGCGRRIRRAAKTFFGRHAWPRGIVLTHGHSDHIGAASSLAEIWDAPIYAHYLEPPDLEHAAKGVIPRLSRRFLRAEDAMGSRVRAIPASGELSMLPGWKIYHTPGDSPGHVSLYCPADGVLIAGDALMTMDCDPPHGWPARRPGLHLPPTCDSSDRQAARDSVRLLAALRPSVLGCGHGKVVCGDRLKDDLCAFAESLTTLEHGRSAVESACAERKGAQHLFRPVPDPAIAVAVAVGLACVGIALARFSRLI